MRRVRSTTGRWFAAAGPAQWLHVDCVGGTAEVCLAEQAELTDRGVLVGHLHERRQREVCLPLVGGVATRRSAPAELCEVHLRDELCDRLGAERCDVHSSPGLLRNVCQ